VMMIIRLLAYVLIKTSGTSGGGIPDGREHRTKANQKQKQYLLNKVHMLEAYYDI
jgi:hypothetical protein